MKKKCTNCEIKKDLNQFPLDKTHNDKHCSLCKKCRNIYRKLHYKRTKKHHCEITMKHQLRRRYGLTIEEYKGLLKNSKNRCKICGQKECRKFRNKVRALSIDHDHKTGKVRGMLCYNCNTGLGLFKDNPKLLQNAMDYLK